MGPMPMTNLCRCGHEREAHSHFNQSTYCALCRCDHFHRGWRSLLWWSS